MRTILVAVALAAAFPVAAPAQAQYVTHRCNGTLCQQLVCNANGSYCSVTKTYYRRDPYDRQFGNSQVYDALFPNNNKPRYPLCDDNGNNCR
ncbi:MAG TPA: hypothetical protein VG867_05740 [Rhizomicrobium sp.]|nr:hypothetical protein [Rhizomicrobium sp.]